MKVPKRPINLGDLLSDIEDSGKSIGSLIVDHDGINDLYDKEDIEFVDPELYERSVKLYEIKEYKKRKVGIHVVVE